MKKKLKTNQTEDEQVAGLVKLMQFMTWKNLTKKDLDPPPHEEVEDIIQDALIVFLLKVRSGKIRNPKGYLYYFIRGFCADALKKFTEERWRFGASLSREFGGEDDNDGCGLTLLDFFFDPQDDPAVRYRLDLQRLLERRQMRRDLRAVLADEPTADLWNRKAQGMSYAQIAKAIGLTPGQVRGRMTRSAPRLRRRLRRLGYRMRGKNKPCRGGRFGDLYTDTKKANKFQVSLPLSE